MEALSMPVHESHDEHIANWRFPFVRVVLKTPNHFGRTIILGVYMHDTSNKYDYDVVIVGAGPVGLFLACELRLSNLSVLVLEKETDPFSPLKCLPFGMRGLSAPTIEAFYRRGLLDHIKAPEPNKNPNAATAHWTKQQRKSGGHFAGIQLYLDLVNTESWQYRLNDSHEMNMQTNMSHIESVLAIQADRLGVEIRRGDGLEGFDQLNDLVIVQTHDDTFKTKWLVGCDGGRSVVRKIGNFEFVGTEPEFTGYSAQIKLENSNLLVSGRHYTPTGMYTYQQPGILAMVDFDGGTFHRTQPITLEHVQSVLRHISGTQAEITDLTLVTTWTDRAFQATSYRKGRVLLAGDAAHIHSPLGGQGLNLGIGDAMNLGWKLAATIRGDAPENLIDSYQLERHPIGAKF
jgi:2-polyprenyl-6-methoxyphenol hydroxylase-like FAD-dependent oxidoreductase